jgi:hypothetical protein
LPRSAYNADILVLWGDWNILTQQNFGFPLLCFSNLYFYDLSFCFASSMVGTFELKSLCNDRRLLTVTPPKGSPLQVKRFSDDTSIKFLSGMCKTRCQLRRNSFAIFGDVRQQTKKAAFLFDKINSHKSTQSVRLRSATIRPPRLITIDPTHFLPNVRNVERFINQNKYISKRYVDLFPGNSLVQVRCNLSENVVDAAFGLDLNNQIVNA